MSALAEKQFLVAKVGAKKAGAAVTITLASAGVYDPTTRLYSTATSSSMTGTMTRVQSDPKHLESLGLTEAEAVTFDWVPDTYGDTPALLATYTISSTKYTIRDVNPWAPDGNTITARVVGVR